MAKKFSTKPAKAVQKRPRPDPAGPAPEHAQEKKERRGRKPGPIQNVAAVPDGFPEQMRVAREALGWSQAKLARNAGLDKRSVGRYEAGLVAPSIQAAAKLAVTLGKSLDVMAGVGPAKTGAAASDPQAQAILAKLQLLRADRKEFVLALVKLLSEK